MKKKTSEFGKGLCYNLALFLSHSERSLGEDQIKDEKVKKILCKSSLWFSASSDHLYEMQIPDTLPKNIQKRLSTFRNKCLAWRCPLDDNNEPTQEDRKWAIEEAKELIRKIDELNGVKTIKAQWD